ncbi:MAG: hypothetical protein IT235_02840 [Bacteroidia bacterium]|nr:hypothetical protein [Bacteroidia bacterium]
MKNLATFLFLTAVSSTVFSQWAPNSTHIYNTNTGNVGIGTGTSFTPTKKLEIRGAAPSIYLNGTTSNFVEFNTTGVNPPTYSTRSTGTKIVFYPVVSGGAVDYAAGVESGALWHSVPTSSNQFKWYAGTGELMRLEGAGNLSLGTTISGGKITVSKSYDNYLSPRANHLYLTDPSNTNLKTYIGINRNSGAGADKEYLSIEAVEENVHWMNIALAAEGGNVGIGTTKPASLNKLQVNGGISVYANDANGVFNGNVAVSFGQEFAPNGNGLGKWGIQYVPAGPHPSAVCPTCQSGLNFWIPFNPTDGNYWGNAYLFLSDGGPTGLTAGYVGIGTANPSQKLDVNGIIRANEVRVCMGTCDFVFENDYKLMPLNQVEKYIKQNKHLPEIASAKEMEAQNGVEMGKMQSKLLQKVEELTLYTIELQKQIEELKKKVK